MPMLYGIPLSVTALTEASRHLLKRQGKKLKRHGAVTLGRFGGNTETEKLNCRVTFPTMWRCASDFFKVLLIFKMAAMDKLHIFLWALKLKN